MDWYWQHINDGCVCGYHVFNILYRCLVHDSHIGKCCVYEIFNLKSSFYGRIDQKIEFTFLIFFSFVEKNFFLLWWPVNNKMFSFLFFSRLNHERNVCLHFFLFQISVHLSQIQVISFLFPSLFPCFFSPWRCCYCCCCLIHLYVHKYVFDDFTIHPLHIYMMLLLF